MTPNNDCQDRRDAIAALVLGELEIPAADEIRQHIDVCRNCRTLYEALIEEEEIVRSAFEAIDRRSKAIEDNLIAQCHKGSGIDEETIRALPTSQKTIQTRAEPGKWRTIMKTKTARFAAAAVILIGVLILTRFFVGTNKSIVLAGVLEKVEETRAFMYKMTAAGNIITVTVSTEYGMKMEMDTTDPSTGEIMTQQTFLLPDEKVMITILPGQKKYTQMEYDDALFARLRKKHNDPREMIKQIMSSKYTELGRSVISSIEVEGFQTADPTVVAALTKDANLVLWVDVETWLPVRTEIEYMSNEQVTASLVIDDYQWNIPVVASDFEPIIPEDFTSLTRDAIKMPSFDEEAALEGLKIVAEIFGQYPKTLNLMDLIQMFFDLRERGIKDNKGLMDAGLTLKEEMNQMKSEHIQKAMEIFGAFQSLGMFYMTLVEEQKEPIYYGESVGPEDADMILMRWKISDNKYRIIFGDLSVGNATAEELAALEEPKP